MEYKAHRKIGIKDIAAKAGVSIGTVDRVLHNRGEVKKETRTKVLAIVEELGYKPNILAKSLASKKRILLSIVIPDSSDNNPYWVMPIKGIKKAAKELEHYNTEVNYVHFDASSEESFKKVLTEVCANQPDGIILNPVFKSASLAFIENFKKNKIPYIFFDINIKGVDNLGYFGQDAEKSGMVAARLLSSNIPDESKILILKQTDKKIFSQHIELRITGFSNYLKNELPARKFNTITTEIDLLEKNEPGKTLDRVVKQHPDIAGIFVPNSRTFKLSDYLYSNKTFKPVIIGYDLVDGNVQLLEKRIISYLISQKPENLANNAILAMFDHLMSKKKINKTNYSPIDIIIKENLEYYTTI